MNNTTNNIPENNEHNEESHSKLLSEKQLSAVSGGLISQYEFNEHLYCYNLPEDALAVYRSDAFWNSHSNIRGGTLKYVRRIFEALEDQYNEDPEGFYNDLAKLKAQLNL